MEVHVHPFERNQPFRHNLDNLIAPATHTTAIRTNNRRLCPTTGSQVAALVAEGIQPTSLRLRYYFRVRVGR